MHKNDIQEFIARMDAHLAATANAQPPKSKFRLNIIGKSALVLAGVTDSTGTVDVDSLAVDGESPESESMIAADLLSEFGRAKLKINGYYLDFVPNAFVFLPQKYEWIQLAQRHAHLDAQYLGADYVVASKLFSAFSQTFRKKDQQDVVAAIDQGIAKFETVVEIADQIFENHSMDARSDRFPSVYRYIKDLMGNYGEVPLSYEPNE